MSRSDSLSHHLCQTVHPTLQQRLLQPSPRTFQFSHRPMYPPHFCRTPLTAIKRNNTPFPALQKPLMLFSTLPDLPRKHRYQMTTTNRSLWSRPINRFKYTRPLPPSRNSLLFGSLQTCDLITCLCKTTTTVVRTARLRMMQSSSHIWSRVSTTTSLSIQLYIFLSLIHI